MRRDGMVLVKTRARGAVWYSKAMGSILHRQFPLFMVFAIVMSVILMTYTLKQNDALTESSLESIQAMLQGGSSAVAPLSDADGGFAVVQEIRDGEPHHESGNISQVGNELVDDLNATSLDFTREPVAVSTTSFSLADEVAASRDYVASFKRIGRPLKFFHIPKTAGTAIEYAAGKKRISWGSCLFNHKPKRDICRYPPDSAECTHAPDVAFVVTRDSVWTCRLPVR
jgi:hypothetical protein